MCHFPDDTLLSGYELVVELVPPADPLSGEHNCSSMQGSLSIDVPLVIFMLLDVILQPPLIAIPAL